MALPVAAVVAGLAVLGGGRDAFADGDVAHGEEIARSHCRRCHRLSDADKFGGLDNVPSFPLLVQNRPDWRERFETFHARRPHPAFITVRGVTQREAHLPPTAAVIEIAIEDVADIVAFVATLKQPAK